jgi:hypothetical protein
VIPDPFLVRNCGPYAVEQLDALVEALLVRGTRFVQAREAALLAQRSLRPERPRDDKANK